MKIEFKEFEFGEMYPDKFYKKSEVDKLLSEGVEVYGWGEGCDWYPSTWRPKDSSELTHKALLIGITKIKQDTAEDILQELIDLKEDGEILCWEELHSRIKRAKALLEKKDLGVQFGEKAVKQFTEKK